MSSLLHVCTISQMWEEINELRYQLFCANPSKSSSLPPTKNALYWHIPRANYQAALLRRALSADPFPSPDGHWWQVLAPNHATDPTAIAVLVPKWMSEPAAPERVLDLVSCKCSVFPTEGFLRPRTQVR